LYELSLSIIMARKGEKVKVKKKKKTHKKSENERDLH
jgi:hypothetical protein